MLTRLASMQTYRKFWNHKSIRFLTYADLAGQHAVIQEVLEPLEHSVLDTALDGQPMEGIPVLEPLEHSVLKMTLDSRPEDGRLGTI